LNSKWSMIAGVIIVIAAVTIFPLWTADAAERQFTRHAAAAPNMGIIAYASDTGEGYDIFLMTQIGSGHQAITADPGNEREPVWSPGGQHVAFLRQDATTGAQDILVMTAQREIYPVFTQGNAVNDFTWSPDGRVLAYSELNEVGTRDIFTWSLIGSAPRALTRTTDNDFFPAWSPDGTQIAFTTDRDGNSEIYLMRADGSNQERLTDYADDDLFPQWSPDGKTILYQYLTDETWDLALINLKDREITALTDHPAVDTLAAWSPDGESIAFTSNRDGQAEVYLLRADGTRQTNLTAHPADDHFGGWSADGKYITFISSRDGNWEIYRMLADGSEQTRLTVNQTTDLNPAWAP
jgi:Tol biopolymer transport system component